MNWILGYLIFGQLILWHCCVTDHQARKVLSNRVRRMSPVSTYLGLFGISMLLPIFFVIKYFPRIR